MCLFLPPFIHQYKVGDLVFGLSVSRRKYSRTYPAFTEARTSGNISTIDDYAATDGERTLQRRFMRQVPDNQIDFIMALSEQEKYKSIIQASGHFSVKGYAVQGEKVITRKCKAGLDWATHSRSPIQIHFILDGIDISQVVEKNNKHDLHGRSYASAELRWIYRNRNDVDVEKMYSSG